MSEFKHLVRIINADLNGTKPLAVALANIKGVGYNFANAVCAVLKIDPRMKVGDISDKQIADIEEAIKSPAQHKIPIWMLNRRRDAEDNLDKHLVSSDLDFVKDMDIKKMKMIRCYKGVRHTLGLPVRGQKTKSHFRENKGKVLGVKKGAAKSGKV